MHEIHARQGNSESGQGIGFRVTQVNGRRTICHGGDGSGFTAYVAAQPHEGVGVAMLVNTGGMQAARSIIGTTALATLAEPERTTISVGRGSGPHFPRSGVYRSTYWDIEFEADGNQLTTTIGLVLSEDPTPWTLHATGDSTFEAERGMFHGFELTVEGDRIYGGLYPYTFVRSGELPEPPPPIDDKLNLIGAWKGRVRTPLGPIAMTLHITKDATFTVDTPFAEGVAVQNARTSAGRIEGDFTLNTPVGEMQMFLRLEARGGRLTGFTHGRAVFGETPFRTELVRA
jgi:hypothetical protein